MSLIVDARSLWFAETNCYVVAPDSGGPCVIIDAPDDIEGIAGMLAEHDLYPQALLLTHAHVDHGGGAAGAAQKWSVNAYLHPDDEWLAADPMSQLRSLFGGALPDWMLGRYQPPESFSSLDHGQVLSLAGLELEVRHTPGHTPGHCCFYVEDEGILFSGDQLFAGSVGRTDLAGGDWGALLTSMRDQVLTLPDDTTVLPGHGPATTISRERLTNPFLTDL